MKIRFLLGRRRMEGIIPLLKKNPGLSPGALKKTKLIFR